ncbi:MBL fold metallo-hydrolase [Streptomyces roseirectus]|uniref:MBL fold metallo-hydrolase n=1 Tax=Streptomyces roseirectus TaxID=2768066 RepID=A0A7H0IJ19_9ACTN|nr:MBL fold metallo-hydrolase [Streptomyces roseirectus]QNP72785.1 MBL fold metallo-hydrolase [Streptomyces roseirectus]
MTVTWEGLGWERLSAGVGRIRLPGWDCTTGLVLAPGAALLIDSGSSLAEGARLRADAERLAGVNVTHLALTHPHFDHVFGAAAFPEAEVYAAHASHDADELTADAVRNGLPEEAARAAAEALVVPDHVVTGTRRVVLGADPDGHGVARGVADASGTGAGAGEAGATGRDVGHGAGRAAGHPVGPGSWEARACDAGAPVARHHPGRASAARHAGPGQAAGTRHTGTGLAPVEVLLARLGPAHTPYDLVVLVPGAVRVVFCGDLVEESGEPQAGADAVPGRWAAALDALLALGGEDAVYVPGHGAVVDAGFVRRQRDALSERFGVSRG